jgi:putative membrane protein
MQLHLPDYFLTDLISTIAFGLVAILLVVLGYKIFDKLTARLDFDDLIMKGNVAMAIVIGSFILGLCHVVARVVSSILGG